MEEELAAGASSRKSSAPAKAALDDHAWVRAALDMLAEEGVDAVRIEPLAARLGVTKGSFYWHFKDRAALLDAVLNDWRKRATLSVIERLEVSGQPAEERLRALLHLPFAGDRSNWGASVELSIRLWGRRDRKARRALKEVDELRLRYFAQLFGALGFARPEADLRAVLAYSFIRVAVSLPYDDSERLLEGVEGLLKTAR